MLREPQPTTNGTFAFMPNLKTFRAADFFASDFHFAIRRTTHKSRTWNGDDRFTREFWKITAILHGNGKIMIDDMALPIHAGSLLLVHPTAKTNFVIESDELTVDNILFDLSTLGGDLELLRSDLRFFDIFSGDFSQKEFFTLYLQSTNRRINLVIDEMREEYNAKATHSDLFIKSKLLELLILMQRSSEQPDFHSSKEQIANYINYLLENNYMRQITLKHLAQKVNLTPGHLCFIYRKATGKSIITALNDIRLEHASRQLSSTPEKILAIAINCGFNDLSYFYRTFRKKYTLNPGEYRKKFSVLP